MLVKVLLFAYMNRIFSLNDCYASHEMALLNMFW